VSKIAKIFGLGKQSSAPAAIQQAPAPLPPLPTIEDPEIEIARKKAISLAKKRKGRRQTILTSGSGLVEGFDSTQPELREATLLGE